MKQAMVLAGILVLVAAGNVRGADPILVEAESFDHHGGWVLDTQFIQNMGSPYLLAHGLGQPVEDATAEVSFPSTGKYRVFVRTLDWVARWDAPGQPGRFQLTIDGTPLKEIFGTKGKDWFWHDGGTVEITKPRVPVGLRDLTGFDGRCDAILFTSDLSYSPPTENEILPSWRRKLLNLAKEPEEKGGYDLVVVGGGYSGMGAALSAARMGCKVALIQDRPVLGGNGIERGARLGKRFDRRGKFPRIGEIIEEFADNATKSPGHAEEFGDVVKEAVVRRETNIDLFLNHHAYRVEADGTKISAVYALDVRTSVRKRFTGHQFADCTGHGTIGFLAGADWEMTPKGRMGMSNMWAWGEVGDPTEFPQTPWALDLDMKDFPYPRDHHGQWFWESGFDIDPIDNAEAIRDWNLRAVYGAFNAMKNRDGRDEHRNAILTWVAFVGGPRESRRLLGDVVLTQEDIVTKHDFPDGCVPSTWTIDLHYPKKQYAEKFPKNPFISIAEHDRRVDRTYGYPVPYRCFYSRNVDNLFMAGRCISVTHEALGTTRVMKTCGMMGEVVGKAASVCAIHECGPREVYYDHLDELKELLRLPGKARRDSVSSPLVVPENVPVARAEGPPTGLAPEALAGIVIDDMQAEKTGDWTQGTGLKGYVGYGYIYASEKSKSTIEFRFEADRKGRYEVRLAYQPHENRGTRVPVVLQAGSTEKQLRLNMRQAPPLDQGFVSLGVVSLATGESLIVRVSSDDAGGLAHADAIQLLPLSD